MSDAANGPQNSEETIFSAALRLPAGAERAAFLEEACAGRGELRLRVEALLRASPELGDFMESPAGETLASPGTIGADGPGGGASRDGTVTRIARAMVAQCAGAQTSALEEGTGTRIGRYKLLQKLGEGGCGVVFMAEQEEPVKRRVALKVIKLGMDTASVIARFEAERQALAMMEHPNIAKVLDADATESGRPYFVMELVRGVKITEFCDRNRLSTRERLDLFIQVCHAVQHAHQKGIIHRDLKPSNILVTVDNPGSPGVPKIIDFGIAKATQGKLTDATLFTAFDQFLGTPAYMSPEQAMMTALDIDTRSDIYSLGVLLYELLTGRTPFEAKDLLAAGFDEMRRTIREKEPLRPSTRLKTLLEAEQTTAASLRQTEAPKLIHLVRGDIDWIVMKCLEKDRARRYETADGLAMDLQRHLSHEPVAARPPSRWYEFQKSVKRHKAGFTAIGLVVAALSIGLAGSLWQAARARRAEREQRRLAYVADMTLAQQAVAAGDFGRARSLLRTYVPKRGEPDLRNWEWRHLASECRGDELFSLAGHEGEVRNVRFLDENTLLSTGMQDLRTKFWDLSKRRPARTITNENFGGGIGLMAWAPKRQRIYFRSAWMVDQVVRTLDLETGNSSTFGKFPFPVTSLDLSPDERILAIASGKQAELRDATTTNRALAPVAMRDKIEVLAFSPDNRFLAVVDQRGGIVLRDLATQEDRATSIEVRPPPATTAAPQHDPWWCRFSRDGLLFVSPSASRQISVCRVEDGQVLRTLADIARPKDAAFSADGKWFATVGEDNSVRLWDRAAWEIKHKLNGHTDPLICVDFAPSGERLATASRNGEVKVWAVGEPAARTDSADLTGSQLTGLVRDGSAFWRVTRQEPVARQGGGAVRITGAEIWSSSPLKRVGSIEMQDLLVASSDATDLSSGGRTFAIGTADQRIHLREMGNPKDLARTAEPLKNLAWAQISLDGSTLAALCFYGRWPIRVWRLPQMELIAERADIPDVHRILLSPDGKSLALLTGRGDVGVLSMPSLEGPPPWKAVENVATWTACVFSPDNRRLATALGSGNAQIWDLATRRKMELPRSFTRYDSMSFSRDGTRLVACDADSASVFDTATGRRVMALKLGGSQVAFAPDGNGLLAVSLRRALMLRAPPLEELGFDWLAPSPELRYR